MSNVKVYRLPSCPANIPSPLPLPLTSESASSQTLSSHRATSTEWLGTDVLRSWGESPDSLAKMFISTIIPACGSKPEELSLASQRKPPNNSQWFEDPCPASTPSQHRSSQKLHVVFKNQRPKEGEGVRWRSRENSKLSGVAAGLTLFHASDAFCKSGDCHCSLS